MPRRSQPPEGFVALARGIYMSVPRPANTAVIDLNDSAPSVILIFGWMGGTTRHIQNYTRKYAEIYPNATQIIVKCGAGAFLWPTRVTRKRLLPVAAALECLGCLPSNNDTARVRPRVLIHSFSNGGGYQLAGLGRILRAKYPSVPASERLHSALILDSTPAIGNFKSISKAFTSAIKSTIARYIALPFIFLWHVAHNSLHTICGGDNINTELYKALLQPNILPWMHLQTPRLYIFSKGDEIVPWKQVQRHAEAAQAFGIPAHCEVYENSAHVNHMRNDPDRYWSAVQELWRDSCRISQGKTISSA